MKLSLKLILASWLLSIAMISTSEAGKFGSLHGTCRNDGEQRHRRRNKS